MRQDFAKDAIKVGALLECFSMPSNIKYLLTEIGIAINYLQHLAVDKTLLNPYEIQVKDGDITNTLFTMFADNSQKNFAKRHITNAKLVIRNTANIKANWEFICDFVCPQYDNAPITLGIQLNLINDDLEVTNVFAESNALNANDLQSLPLILMLLQT